MLKTIEISAKCSDMFRMNGLDENGNNICGVEYQGYVPSLVCSNSDCVQFKIDVETGRILNWKPFSEEDYLNLLNEDYFEG